MLKLQPIRRSSRISVKRHIFQEQSGFTLVEALVSILLLSIIVIGILTVAISAYKAERFVDARETAKNYAEWEMEYVKAQPYLGAYSPAASSPYPSNYTVQSIVVTPNLTQSGEQQITITIQGNGVTYTLSDNKVNY